MILTSDQKRILRFIRRGPTNRRKIAGRGGLFASDVKDLDVLEERGLITCQLNKSGRHIRAMKAV